MNKNVSNPWGGFIALLFSTFVTIEAAAFQAPVLPSVTRHFAIPVNLAALILVFYFIAVAVCAPMTGRLGDWFGRRRLVGIGLVIFGVAEFMASWAPSFWIFLLARSLQGLGVACIFPAVFSYVNYLFREDRRGTPLGVLTFVMTCGAASGGLLGGLMIDSLGWRSVYLVSGALALLGLIPLLAWVPEQRGQAAIGRLDWRGALLLFATIAALLSLPTWAANFGSDSWLTWSIAGVGVVSLLWLWRHSGRQPAPVLEVSLLKDRRFAIPSAIYWIQMILSSGVVYSLAFAINTRPGGSAAQFGMVTLALYGCTMLASLIAGKLIDRVEPRSVARLSLIGSLGAVILFSRMDILTPLSGVAMLAGFIGLMMGANTPALMKLALGAVPPHKAGAGSGLFSMLRDLGSPTGSSLALAIFGLSSSFHTRRVAQETSAELGLNAAQAAQLLHAATRNGSEVGVELKAVLVESGASVEQVLERITVASLGGAISSVGYLLTGLLVLALALTPFLARRTEMQAVCGERGDVAQGG